MRRRYLTSPLGSLPARISTWCLDGNEQLRKFQECDHVSRLAHVELGHCRFENEEARILADNPQLANTSHLRLDENRIGQRRHRRIGALSPFESVDPSRPSPRTDSRQTASSRLLRRPNLTKLRSLKISDNSIAAKNRTAVGKALASRKAFCNLKHLELRFVGLGDEGLRVLAKSAISHVAATVRLVSEFTGRQRSEERSPMRRIYLRFEDFRWLRIHLV